MMMIISGTSGHCSNSAGDCIWLTKKTFLLVFHSDHKSRWNYCYKPSDWLDELKSNIKLNTKKVIYETFLVNTEKQKIEHHKINKLRNLCSFKASLASFSLHHMQAIVT